MTMQETSDQPVPEAKRRRVRFAWSIALFVGTLALIGVVVSEVPPGSSRGSDGQISLRPGLDPRERLTAVIDRDDLGKAERMYSELTGRELLPSRSSWRERLDHLFGGRLSRWQILRPVPRPDSGVCYHRDGRFSAQETKEELEAVFRNAGLNPAPAGGRGYRLVRIESGLAVVSGSRSSEGQRE